MNDMNVTGTSATVMGEHVIVYYICIILYNDMSLCTYSHVVQIGLKLQNTKRTRKI